MIYHLVHNVGDGSWNLLRFFPVSFKVICEENEEWEGEGGHSFPDHPGPVHQHIQSSDFIRVIVLHSSPKSNHLLRANVNISPINSSEILPEMQVHRRGRKDQRGTKRDQWILLQGTLGIYLKTFSKYKILILQKKCLPGSLWCWYDCHSMPGKDIVSMFIEAQMGWCNSYHT